MVVTVTTVWQDLYEREYPRLLRALAAMGGDPDAAEDAAQEAFVRLHKHGIEGLVRPGAWLLVVATRELFRHRRRTTREREGWSTIAESVPVGAPYDAAADRADLLAALRQLPERQRAMVVARYYYGLSYDEIAAEFNVKGGTVGATLHQALEKLRQLHIAGKLARGSMA